MKHLSPAITATKHLLAAAMGLAALLPALAAPVAGVSSGDTLTVIEGSRSVKIRLAYIDAPEPRQPYANHSRRSLSELCAGKDAKYDILYTDRKKQAIAIVHCNGINANHYQVARGMAWVYDEYNKDDTLFALQQEARKARLGIWQADIVTPPWEFRRLGFTGRIDGKKSFSE